jgi:hypothetical protein
MSDELTTQAKKSKKRGRKNHECVKLADLAVSEEESTPSVFNVDKLI